MDGVYEELDEAKHEAERLRSDYLRKVEQCEGLKKMYDEQVGKLQRLSAKVDSQSHELSQTTGELTSVKELCEQLKRNLIDKELNIKHLGAANDALRSELHVKLRELEEEKRALVISLDEANEKSTSQEHALRVLTEEIVVLKGLLEYSRKRCSEEEEKAKAPKEVRERDDIIGNLEEEKRKLEDKLKWKKEQFQHLEEAHEKMRREYKQSKKEWEEEKSAFLNEICSLQSNLESQTRISADLGDRLQRCNQALVHEESRRRTLESQVSDYKAKVEDVFSECGSPKSRVETFNSERDKETVNLRYTLEESILKEMEYQTRKLELENQELLASLKQLQEEKISHVGNSSSLSKLRNRLKNVEQMHRDSSANYKAKEAAWTSELAKLTSELVECRSELVDKDVTLEEIKKELESCHASLMHLMLLNEEITVMLLVMKSGISEAKIKLAGDVADLQKYYGRRDEHASYVIKQLEVKNGVMSKAYNEIVKEHEKVRDDVERCKGMLEESSRCQIYLREQVSQVEIDSNGKIREVRDALDKTGSELAEKINEANQIEFELHIWSSIAERLKFDMEENYRTRIELEASLLAQSEVEDTIKQEKNGLLHQIKEKDRIIESLQNMNALLKRELEETELHHANVLISESSMPFEMERESLFSALGEKDHIVEELRKEIDVLEQESLMNGIEGIVYANEKAEARFEIEKHNYLLLVEEKNQRVEASLLAQSEDEDTFKQENNGLLHQIKEKDRIIESLQNTNALLKRELEETELHRANVLISESSMPFEMERESLFSALGEKENIVEELRKEIGVLEQESLMNVIEEIVYANEKAEARFEIEKHNYLLLVEEKNQRVEDLMQIMKSAEAKFVESLEFVSSKLTEKEAELDCFREAFEKITAAKVLSELELEEKKMMVVELEVDVANLQKKLEITESSLSLAKARALKVEASLDAKQLEMKKLIDRSEESLASSDALISELKDEKLRLCEDLMVLINKKESMAAILGETDDEIQKCSREDVKLSAMLESIVQSIEGNCSLLVIERNNENVVPMDEDPKLCGSSAAKRSEIIVDGRPPFREIN